MTRQDSPAKLFRKLAIMGALAIVYFIASKYGLQLAYSNPSVSPIWPPAGIAVSALLLLGIGFWPAIFIGSFFINYLISSPTVAIGISIGNTLEAIVIVFLIMKLANGRDMFDKASYVLRFSAILIVAALIGATLGSLSLAFGGFLKWDLFFESWSTWWLGDVIGAALFVPLIVLWSRSPKIKLETRKIIEFAILLVVLFSVCQMIFGSWLPQKNLPIAFLIAPVFIWSAYRFGQKENALVILLGAAMALGGTLNGYGPFAAYHKNDSLVLLQSFLGVQSITFTVLAALVYQKKKTEAELRKSLKFKDAMINEFQERIKNNLRRISPLSARQDNNNNKDNENKG